MNVFFYLVNQWIWKCSYYVKQLMMIRKQVEDAWWPFWRPVAAPSISMITLPSSSLWLSVLRLQKSEGRLNKTQKFRFNLLNFHLFNINWHNDFVLRESISKITKQRKIDLSPVYSIPIPSQAHFWIFQLCFKLNRLRQINKRITFSWSCFFFSFFHFRNLWFIIIKYSHWFTLSLQINKTENLLSDNKSST